MDVVAAINALPEGGLLKVPAGTYTIQPDKAKLKKGVTLDLTGVTLKIPPQSESHYSFFTIDKPGVTIKGGTLIGDREEHKGTTGAHGHGIRTLAGALNTKLEGVTCTKMWGDGFMLAGGSHITLKRVVSDGNRRQGLSICDGSDIRVLDSIFKNTRGTPPQAGIDIEPWMKSQLVNGVQISGCQLSNNRGHGITINATHGPIRNVRVMNCAFAGNGKRPLNYYGWSKWQEFLADIGIYRPTSIVIA